MIYKILQKIFSCIILLIKVYFESSSKLYVPPPNPRLGKKEVVLYISIRKKS